MRLGSQKKLQKGGYGVAKGGFFPKSKVTALSTTQMQSTTVEQVSRAEGREDSMTVLTHTSRRVPSIVKLVVEKGRG